MSKNTTKKGLAFGALVGLTASLLAGAPAQASSSGPLTLLPNGGTAVGATYTSIIGAGLSLTSSLDVGKQSQAVVGIFKNSDNVLETVYDAVVNAANDDVQATAVNAYNAASGSTPLSITVTGDSSASESDNTVQGISTSFTADAENSTLPVAAVDPLEHVYYLVENDDAADLTVTLTADVDGTLDFYLFNAGSGDSIRQTTAGDSAVTSIVDNTVSTLVTTATKFAIRAAVGATAGNRTVSPIKIDATDKTVTTPITVEVTSFADTLRGSLADNTAKINNGEFKSATQEVTLIPAGSASVNTAMSSVTDRTGVDLVATVTLGSSVNPYAVASSIGTAFFVDGDVVNLTGGTGTVAVTTALVSGDVEYSSPFSGGAAVGISTTTGAITVTVNAEDAAVAVSGDDLARVDAVASTKLIAGVYTARTVFLPTTPDIYVGSRSVALDLRDGTNTLAEGARVKFTKGDNVAVSSGNDATLRAGTLALNVVGQVTKDTSVSDATQIDLKAAGVRMQAAVTGVTAHSTSSITVTGSSVAIDSVRTSEDVIVIAGFTNSNGEFPITINSTTGKNLDSVSVRFGTLIADGTYEGSDVETITWETAALQAIPEISPSEFLTGDNISVTFTAVDQFGVGIDQNTTGRISIRVDAYVDGAVKTATYSDTKATTNGAATFSFANFATAGSNQEIRVQILNASTAASTNYYTVYNNLATGSIAIADVFENRVQYVDYVVGKTSDAAALKAATDAGVIAAFGATAGTEFANIVGTALAANNAGQPGIPVVIAAEGVLFHDAETSTIAKDSITVFANGQGFFDVQAIAQTVNAKGATVTITAGGKTATTLLKTFLPIAIDSGNLQFAWNLPANIVKNTTYSVGVTLTDVWGNALNTLKTSVNAGGTAVNTDALTVSADGSLQVNGVATVARNFNNVGQATVFIRSVTDIAGPGQLRAAVVSLNYLTGKAASEIGGVTTTANTNTDVTTTSWNESLWSGTISKDIDVLDVAPVAAAKVNAGSFKGYVALYALGYEGQRLSAKVGNDWVIVPVIPAATNDLYRKVEFVGAGVEISVRLYIDRVLVATIPLLTK